MRRRWLSRIWSSAVLVVFALGLLSTIRDVVHGSGKVLVILLAAAMVVGGIALLVRTVFSVLGGWTSRLPSGGTRSSGDRDAGTMADVCLAFYRFLQELDRTPRCQEELAETPGLDGVGMDRNDFTLSQKLAFMVFCDVRDVFVRLGHDTGSLHGREGAGYAMLVFLLVSRDADLSWFDDPVRSDKALSIVEDLSRTDVGNITIEGHENELRFTVIFGELHHERDWVNRYATLLYRWASVLARTSGSVSAAERDVLKSLVDLQARGGGSSVSGNVRVSGGSGDCRASGDREPSGRAERSGRGPFREADATCGLDALRELIGLEPVKREVRKLASFIEIQRKRESSGLRAAPVSYHCVFTGNPGTGKTTVARILADIYREMGVVEKGHLVETDRSGLIGEYVGHTAVKTNKVIDTALDGVLFIDEAYSLVQGGQNDYGREAIATLLKRMEDDRNRLVVILAGYTAEMKEFIDSNPGLQSRFNRYIEFPDYSAEELARIFLKKAEECQYFCNRDVRASIVDIMKRAVETKDRNFGNGRFVRNLFENAIQRQAERLSGLSPLTFEMLAELTLHDLGFAYEN